MSSPSSGAMAAGAPSPRATMSGCAGATRSIARRASSRCRTSTNTSNRHRKTLRTYSDPVDLRQFAVDDWVTNEDDCWDVGAVARRRAASPVDHARAGAQPEAARRHRAARRRSGAIRKRRPKTGASLLGSFAMKILIMFVLITFAATGRLFAQIPAEWQAAAQAVIGDLERDTPLARQALDRRGADAGLAHGARLAQAQQRQYRDHPGRVPDLRRALPPRLRRQHHRGQGLRRRGRAGEEPAGAERRALRCRDQRPCLAGGRVRSDRGGA